MCTTSLLTEDNMSLFLKSVSLRCILRDIWANKFFHPGSKNVYTELPGWHTRRDALYAASDLSTKSSNMDVDPGRRAPPNLKRKLPYDKNMEYTSHNSAAASYVMPPKKGKMKSREEIMGMARVNGASGG